jgi:hypothetical protein
MALDFNSLYQNTLGRAPDAGGLAYWQGLAGGGMSDEDLKKAFYQSAVDEVQGDTTGISAATDAWDTKRMAEQMAQYNDVLAPKFGDSEKWNYWDQAGSKSAPLSERFGAMGDFGDKLNANTDPFAAFGRGKAPTVTSTPALPESTGFNPSSTKFSDPFKYDQKNPYLADMSKAITGDITSNLTRNIMPQIASGAQQVGGFGGSRQGVVEANALNDANKQAANALTGMYYGDYNNAMGRQLQKYGMDQGYNLGMGNLQLGNRNTDLNQMQVGANLFQQGNTGFLNQGQGTYNLGLTAQQAPWQAYNNFNQGAQPYTGTGSTTSTQGGSGAAGFLGGAVGASQLYNIFK